MMDSFFYTTCGICYSSYDVEKKKPLVLPCSHSFCQECLQQLDRDGNKLCPCCRESWQSLKLTELTFCRQLIPEQAHVKTSSAGMNLCEQHNACLTLWCDACQCLVCIKCSTVNHSECELRLIKDKRADLVKKCSDILKDLTVININESDILILNENLKRHKKITWEKEISEELKMLEESDTKLSIEESVKKCEQTVEKIKTDKDSASLLMLVTKAYAATRDDSAKLFISNFLANKNYLDKLHATAAADRSDSKRGAPELKEGEVWTLKDCEDLDSAPEILGNTSVRPSVINIKFHDSERMKDIQQLFSVLSLTKSEKRLALLDCFWTVSDSSRNTTRKVVDQLIQTKWCSLEELWGHLDADAVKLLPNTVRRVGLVLASADDMEAVNALQAAVANKTLQRIDLSILQTFKMESWVLNWNFSVYNCNNIIAGFQYLLYSDYCSTRLALHFPNVRCSHIAWMANIIKEITAGLSYINYFPWLYLPGTTLTPDGVLGIIRDTGFSEVHLPPGLTAEHDREEVAVQYKKYNCTIVWDAE